MSQRQNRAAIATIWLAVLVLPLSEWRFGADAATPLRLVVVAALLGCAAFASRKSKHGLTRAVYVAAAVCGVAFLGAAAAGATPVLSLLGRFPRYEGVLMLAAYLAIIAAGAIALGFQQHRSAALQALVALEAVLAVQVMFDTLAGEHRPITSVGNPSDAALVGLVGFAVLGWQALQPKPRRTWLWVGAGLSLVVVLLCGSRGAWVGLGVVGLALLVALVLSGRWRVGALAGLATGLAAAAGWFVPQLTSRGVGVDSPDTASGRLLLWQETWQLWLQHPWLGVGPSRFVDEIGAFHTRQWAAQVGPANPPDSPHNIVLQVLASAGVIGALAIAGLVATVIVVLLRRRDDWAVGVLIASLGVGTALLFHFTNLWSLGVLLFLLGGGLGTKVLNSRWQQSFLAVVAVGAFVLGVAGLVTETRLANEIQSSIEQAKTTSLAKAVAAKPWDPDFARRSSYAVVALAKQGIGEAQPVLPTLARACAALPRSTECAQTLADTQLLAGQADAAVATLEAARAYDPTNSDTLLRLAEAYAAASNSEAAIRVAKEVTELRPRDAAPWDLLAEVYQAAGDPESAAFAQIEASSRK